MLALDFARVSEWENNRDFPSKKRGKLIPGVAPRLSREPYSWISSILRRKSQEGATRDKEGAAFKIGIAE